MSLTDRLAAAQRSRAQHAAAEAPRRATERACPVGDARPSTRAPAAAGTSLAARTSDGEGQAGRRPRPVRGREANRARPAGRDPRPQAVRRPHDAVRARAAGALRAADGAGRDRPAHVERRPRPRLAGDRRRHPGLRPDRAPAARPRPVRGHGQRVRQHLHRAQRQAGQDRRGVQRRGPPASHDRQDRQQDRPPRRRDQPDVRRPPPRRQPRQRDHPAAGARRLQAHDPEVLRGPLHGRGPHQLRIPHPALGQPARGLRPGSPQHPGVRRHRRRQDDHPQRAVVVHPRGRADRHHRGRRRAPAAPGPRAAPRVPAGQHRGQGRGHHPRPRQELAAHAPRPRGRR